MSWTGDFAWIGPCENISFMSQQKKTQDTNIDFCLLSCSVCSNTVKVTWNEEEKACIDRWHFILGKECWQTFIFKSEVVCTEWFLDRCEAAGFGSELWYFLVRQRAEEHSVREINDFQYKNGVIRSHLTLMEYARGNLPKFLPECERHREIMLASRLEYIYNCKQGKH